MKAKDDCATDHLVGIDDQVEAVMDLLNYDFGCARCLGIHGPGGVGKTTLAKVLFDKLISNFDQYCFLQDVGGSSRRDGLLFLQKKLLSNILDETMPMINIPVTDAGMSMDDINDTDNGMKAIRENLNGKKNLIILDDVDHREQLEKLIGKIHWFGIGNRIVITTRNKSILESVENIILCELKELNSDQAFQLYKNHAFKRESPGDDYYDRLSRDIVSTIGGLPLIVKVIGSLLHGKHETIWKDTLEKLRSIAHEEVHRKLKISYDALNFKQKQIFLDIACLSFREEEINASYMWEDCDFFSQTEIEVLSSLSLIHIKENGGLWMHDMLKDLGCQIVHEENLDPRKRSRFWIPEEAVDMVKTRENKGNIEALSLAADPTLLIFTDEDFARLPNLRFLELDGGSFIGDFSNLFSKLRWLSWCHYPPDLMATNLFPQNLIVLQLSNFNEGVDWQGWSQIKMLHNLKVLELTSLNISEIDLSGCFTLERLIIKGCPELSQINCSIGKLRQLAYLDIEGPNQLTSLPEEIGLLVKLEHLSLRNCFTVWQLPDSMGKLISLIKLDLSDTSIKGLPCSVGYLVSLKSLSLVGCRGITKLPYSIGDLESLIELDLSFTFIKVLPPSIENLKTLTVIKMERCMLAEFPSVVGLALRLEVIHARGCFPMVGQVSSEIGKLSFLRILDLSDTHICRVPETIAALPHLEELILEKCDELDVLPPLPTSLTHLLVSSRSLQSIPDFSNLTNLVKLLLSQGKKSSSSSQTKAYNLEWIGKLSKLEILELCLPNIIMSPTVLGSLSRLRKLYTSGHLCPEFLMQPTRSAMQGNLNPITTFSGLSNLRNVIVLKLYRSLENAIQLDRLEQLRHLTVGRFRLLETIVFSLAGLKNLKELELEDCPELREIRGLGELETLETLKVHSCPSIGRLIDLWTLLKPIPDECQVVITNCPKLSDTSGGRMFYKEYLSRHRRSNMRRRSDIIRSKFKGEQDDGDVDDGDVDDDDVDDGDEDDADVDDGDEDDDVLDDDDVDNGDEDDDVLEFVDKMLKKDGGFILKEEVMAERKKKPRVASIKNGDGADEEVNHILSLMNINDKDERIVVVIHGEGGIGKTTLAKLIYNQVSCDFDGCSFLADIKEATQVVGGLQLLQTKLISDILNQDLEDVDFVDRGIEFFRDLFCSKRVLIILDDVENAFSVRKLFGDCFDCFASGSRILVTTRSSVVLDGSPQIRTYVVSRLDRNQAFELFRQHASIPSLLKMSSNPLFAVAGVPLFIEVMVAFFNVKTKEEWDNLLVKWWSSFRDWDFQRILKEGYQKLNYGQKQIFLDIACFTTGVDSRIALYLWPDSSFLPSSEVLTPLAKIGENNQIWMHSILRRLGREIVREENLTDPGRRSRLFNHEIALDTIKRKKGTEKVEALCLNFQGHTTEKMTAEDFKSMPNLRFLQLDHADIAGDFTNVFPNLRWFRWHGCPRHLQVTNFHLGNLTILDLSWSKVTRDWDGWDQIEMKNLRVLDLTGCADLLVTPKFSGCQNLAILILERCSQLVKIDRSIGDLKCLVSLNLKFCTVLSILPVEVGRLTALQELLMDGTSVQEIPVSIGLLKQLETLSVSNCSSLSQLPRTICHLTNISLLSLDRTGIAALPVSIGELVRLKHLSLRDCCQISKLPNSIGNIGRSLVELDVSGTGVVKFPHSLKNLQNLKVLRMDCGFFKEFPPDIGELTSLEEIHACWCRSLEGGIPSEIGKLHNLRILRLRHSTISSIPAEIHQLSNLRTLDLLHCDMIKELPELPSSITVLYVDDELKSSHLP